jgi:hypothetical protein
VLRSAWTQATTGGMAQLSTLFPGDMSVEVTSTPPSASEPVAYAATVSLAPQTSVAPLADNGTNIDSYAASLWYQGALPAWGTWPSADDYAVFRPVSADGAFFDSLSLQLVQCTNSRTEAYGDNCTTSGPGAGLAAPQPAPAAPAGAAAQRRLAQFGQISCVQFLREVRVPQLLGLELVPPRGCVAVGGARCAGNWTLRASPQGCGTNFITAQAQVSEATWLDDLRSGSPPAWCTNWSVVLPRALVPPPAILAVRSQYDPVVQAAIITGCSGNFGPTTFQYAAFAMNLIVFGVSVVTIAGCCLAALVARAASFAAVQGERTSLNGGGGGADGFGAYGSTGWYGGNGGRSFY